jgi:hypothetical protein
MWSKGPQNTDKYFWTEHAKFKMQYYGLSAQKILGVIRRPKRKEEGIVENTIAVMQPAGSKRPSEVWVMYQLKNSKLQISNSKKIQNSKFKIRNSANRQIRIISAWRYPGISPKKNPIPEEIIREIADKL